jgi:hypothetical protein
MPPRLILQNKVHILFGGTEFPLIDAESDFSSLQPDEVHQDGGIHFLRQLLAGRGERLERNQFILVVQADHEVPIGQPDESSSHSGTVLQGPYRFRWSARCA